MPWLPQLAVLIVIDQWRAIAVDLTCALPQRLARLRHLDFRNLRVSVDDFVLESLPILESLVLLRERPLSANSQPQAVDALPWGISALHSLTEMRATCNYHILPPLDLPALQVLQLDAPPVGNVVCCACAQACRAWSRSYPWMLYHSYSMFN